MDKAANLELRDTPYLTTDDRENLSKAWQAVGFLFAACGKDSVRQYLTEYGRQSFAEKFEDIRRGLAVADKVPRA